MAYKVMGITAGRKNSNSEILLKEALTVCEAQGADVTMISLRDFNILDCTGCTACTKAMSKGKHIGCTLDGKDDKKRIMDAMLSQDAVIFSVPTYDLMPASAYLTFAHRSLSYETSFLETIGAIEHKDRVAGLISVGGSTRSWQSMALEGLQATMFTTDMKVVDMMLATRVPAPAQCLLDDKLMARARALGEHIMQAVATPAADRKWLGEEEMGWCPNCHSNALVLGEMQWDGVHYPIECQVCGAGGTLEKTEDGKWKFVIQKDGLLKDRTTVAGRAKHLEEIAQTQGGFFSDPGMNVLEAALQNGIYIPHLCHHPDLPDIGSCRLCIVEVEGQEGVQPACKLAAREGLKVTTNSPRIAAQRKLAMELLLAAHPEDCSTCPKYGRCELQTLIQYMGVSATRMHTRVKGFAQNNQNPLIIHDMNRCVLCGRCVRGCAEVCPTGTIRDIIEYSPVEKKDALIPCQATCPAHTDVPRYVRFVKEGKYAEALAVIHEKLPFPECLGHVCAHPCESECRRGQVNEAVSIRNIKRYAAEHGSNDLWKQNSKHLPATGKKVCVVGGGPSGMTAAWR